MRLQNGIDITRESWQVFARDRHLLVFPILSMLSATLIVCTVASILLFPAELNRWVTELVVSFGLDATDAQVVWLVAFACLFVAFFVQHIIVIYCNTALVGCAVIRFSGGEPTVKDGIRIATKRLPQIVAWAALSAVVGAILSAVERRLAIVGQLIMTAIGLGWIVACYFVVPVLAQEGTGPITALKRSVGLLRKTWGEGLTGNIVIYVTSFFVKAILLAWLGAGLLLAHLWDSFDLAVVTVAVFLLCAFSLTIFTSALRQIFLAGLYTYAQTGSVPHGFSENSVRHALLPSK